MAKYPLQTCSRDDEDCCQICRATDTTVFYKAVEGTDNCSKHGGVNISHAKDRAISNTYRLEIWQRRLKEFTQDDSVKSLRDEIGILRIVLEGIMKKCGDDDDLLMYSNKIGDIATKIEKLVTACHRVEKNMGELLDKTTAIRFAARLLEVVTKHVADSNALESISEEVLEEIRTL